MKLAVQEIRHIIKDEINKFLLEQLDDVTKDSEILSDPTAVKTLTQKVKSTPHLQADIKTTVTKIVTNPSITANIEKLTKNPVAAASFITQLMKHLNLNPQSYTQLMAQVTESKKSHIASVLNNCVKLIKGKAVIK